MEQQYCKCDDPDGTCSKLGDPICHKCGCYMLNDQEKKVKAIVHKLTDYYDNERKKGNWLIGAPYSLVLQGSIEAQKCHNLAIGIESDLKAEFNVHDFLDKVTETLGVDLNDISGVNITLSPGDVAQICFSTYDGNKISCPLSSVKVTFDKVQATDYTIAKFKR